MQTGSFPFLVTEPVTGTHVLHVLNVGQHSCLRVAG